jgi:flagellar protein FliS
MAGYGQNQYLKTQVTTVEGVKLIVLLYEGAIKFLLSAQEGIREKNIVKRHNNIYRVLDIILELRNSLNFSQGGEIAKSLNALYIFMEGHLITANIQNDAQKIQEVVNLLSSLKEAWETIASRPEVRKTTEAPGRSKGIRI